MPRHRNIAAALTLLLIVALVIVPAIILAMALVQEATLFYAKVQTGEINFARMFAQFQAILPRWAAAFLERLGITNFAAVREMLRECITSSFRTVPRSEEHTSELQPLMSISYAVFCLQ